MRLVRALLASRPERDERGATLVIVSLLAIVLFGVSALAVDIASLAVERQKLHDHVDSAAHAGAYELPGDPAAAVAQATAFATAQDPSMTPAVQLYCVVASTGAAKTVRTDQIPATCNPGAAPYTSSAYPGLRCNTKICAIPCPATAFTSCNTVQVSDSKRVDYDFAPAIGYQEGDTGSVASTACKGSCGEEEPNPMDIVVVADRTPSMATADRQAMVQGIRGMLSTMDPTLQYVALGTIHKSPKPGDPGHQSSCRTKNTGAKPNNGNNSNAAWQPYAETGTWIPVEFSDDYLNTSGLSNAVDNNSELGRGLTCLHGQSTTGSFGTQLAAPMKAAARYLLDMDPNNLHLLPNRPGEPRKVLIFETDGQPDETWSGGSSSLGTSGDVAYGRQAASFPGGSDANGVAGCEGLVDVAEQAKAEGILVITIGFGGAATAGCKKRTGAQTAPYVRDYLAAAASPAEDGSPTTATDCNTPALRAQENADNDYFFCTTEGSEMANIFKAAISQASTGIRLIKLP